MSVCLYVSIAKAEVEGQLRSAELSVTLQEEAMRQNVRERTQLMDKMTSLEQTLSVAEADKQQLQVMCFFHLTSITCFTSYQSPASVTCFISSITWAELS